jgi:hypothetical protein
MLTCLLRVQLSTQLTCAGARNFSQCSFKLNFYGKFALTMVLPVIAACISGVVLAVWYWSRLSGVRAVAAAARAAEAASGSAGKSLRKDGRSASFVLAANPMTRRMEQARRIVLPESDEKKAAPADALAEPAAAVEEEVPTEARKAPVTEAELRTRTLQLFGMSMVVILFMLHNMLTKVRCVLMFRSRLVLDVSVCALRRWL